MSLLQDEPELKQHCIRQLFEICCDLAQMDNNMIRQIQKAQNKLNKSGLLNSTAGIYSVQNSRGGDQVAKGRISIFFRFNYH